MSGLQHNETILQQILSNRNSTAPGQEDDGVGSRIAVTGVNSDTLQLDMVAVQYVVGTSLVRAISRGRTHTTNGVSYRSARADNIGKKKVTLINKLKLELLVHSSKTRSNANMTQVYYDR